MRYTGDARRFPRPFFAAFSLAAIPLIALADMKPVATFDQDVQAFAISQDNHIIYAVQRMKRIKKLIVEHDDFWVGDVDGKRKKIIDGDKFDPDAGFRGRSAAGRTERRRGHDRQEGQEAPASSAAA